LEQKLIVEPATLSLNVVDMKWKRRKEKKRKLENE
jgi:hypothetical protein